MADYKIQTTYKANVRFEKSIDIDGCNYLVIYGTHINGGYIAIPNWNICCEAAAKAGETFYNTEQLIKAGLSENAAKGIAYAIDESINPVKAAEKNDVQPLLTSTDTLDKSSSMNYKDQLLIIKPECLNSEYCKAKYQYFYAETGFGCDPNSLGTKIYGKYLYDGEEGELRRSEFYGVADPDKLPDWVRDKLDEIRNPILSVQDNGRK